MDRLISIGLLVSRILLSSIFLFSGVKKIFAFQATQGYMASFGMQMTAVFLVLAILFEIGGGLSLLLGWYPRLGALALICFLVPTTLVFHRNFADPGQIIQFSKNVAILGGLFAILSAGGGSLSLCRKKAKGRS
ncbi:MAG: DoxX family protein [Deltaproteobacteria bacterium]